MLQHHTTESSRDKLEKKDIFSQKNHQRTHTGEVLNNKYLYNTFILSPLNLLRKMAQKKSSAKNGCEVTCAMWESCSSWELSTTDVEIWERLLKCSRRQKWEKHAEKWEAPNVYFLLLSPQ